MVMTPLDIKPSVLMLTEDEVAEAWAAIGRGELPADWFEQCAEARRKNVFGFDYKTDKAGNPIEQGLGSPGNQTRNSIESYRKYGANDVDYEKNLSRMERELVTSEARRAAERAAAPKRRRPA